MPRAVILLVDDEPRVTAALRRTLVRQSYEVLTVESAREALVVLGEREVDLVISDESMPGMSGTEFLSRVCEKHPDTIRMLLTGHASLDSAIRAINDGQVFRFLTKPCSELDLLTSVRQALQLRELARSSRALLREYRRQASVLSVLETQSPGISAVETDEDGAIVLDGVDDDVNALLAELEREVSKAEEQRRRSAPAGDAR